ncbi:hypothetical protein AAFF_G00099570 [Aldrovandia affinis]|uniref:FAM161 centrosomal protein B n=1 Tax=Aldrovandia affinis TaxID=143900 RepID=A0AAD7WBT3_9TELE|nr:hypothetical protein AAFF_G00099570 [Aldrovandia affinis]
MAYYSYFIKFCYRFEGPRRSHSLSDLSSVKTRSSRTSRLLGGSQKPATAPAARASGTTMPQPFSMTVRETLKKSQLLHHKVPQDAQRLLQSKQETEDAAECQKQFRATPALGHAFLSLCRDVTDARERARTAGLVERRAFLLSMQRPFSFCEREEKRKEEIRRQLGGPALSPSATKPVKVRKPIPKAVKDPGVSEHLKEEEQHRKIRIQTRAQDMLRSSTAPIETRAHREGLEKRSAQRTKEEALSFLEEKPTFQPRTNSQVPDFERLYRAFQKEALRRAEKKDVTRCQPFQLRTSALPPRQSQKSCEPAQEEAGKTHLKRSHSFSGITSLSTDTLPIYITDAARTRCSAIRRSMEEQASKEKESAQWMQKHNMKSCAMKNMVTSRAKAMDPHRSLKEVYHEKLKQHRETDQKRMKEYKMELQQMKTRVKIRPYLFEQVSQKNAKSDAERRYRARLEQAGLNEHFVKEKGESAGATPPFSSAEDDQGSENDIQHTRSGTEEAAAGAIDVEEEKESA